MKVKKRINLFKKKFSFEPEAFEICPRWDKCAVNKYPLHKAYSQLKSKPEDKEQKCKVAKAIRKPIGEYFGLKNKGLKESEIAGLRIWENMSPEEREAKNGI